MQLRARGTACHNCPLGEFVQVLCLCMDSWVPTITTLVFHQEFYQWLEVTKQT